MPRCGCAGNCRCTIDPGENVTITGRGSAADPYIVSASSGGGGGSTFGADPDWRVGSFVWLQKQIDIPHDTQTVVGWDASNILFFETEPSLTPFWTFPGGAGWPVTYQPGVYEVAVSLGINDIPATATGKAVKYHPGGFERYFIISPDQASSGSVTTYATWQIVVLTTGGFYALFPTGGEVRITQMLGEQLDDVFVNLIVNKIGHVD